MESNQCPGCEKAAAGGISLSCSCQNLFGLAVENAPVGIAAVKNGKVLYVNLACAQMMGCDYCAEVVGKEMIDYVASGDRENVSSFVRDIREKGLTLIPGEFFETMARKKNGQDVYLRVRLIRVITKCQDMITICYLTDGTEEKKQIEALRKRESENRKLAITDALTGVYNRRFMEETFERELARARRHKLGVGVIMFDLDHFKQFNDTFGHPNGDKLLQKFAKVLMSSVRKEDIACRYGGEEFIVIMPDADLDVVEERAEMIRLATKKLQINCGKKGVGEITVSGGISFYPHDAVEIEGLLSTADEALYQAKNRGRNRVVVA